LPKSKDKKSCNHVILQNESEDSNPALSAVGIKPLFQTSSSSFQSDGLSGCEERKLKLRILLVDDDKDIAEMFRKGLALKGFQVEAFSDPQLLLEKFEPGEYDILITDLRMPGINGIELYEKIKKVDNKIKVFFLSAYEIYEKETIISLELNPNSFIRKPISIENLSNLIVS